MIAGSDPTGSGRRMQEAICRAKLAATLMQAGRDAEAAEEYEYAMKLIGESDINKVKRLAQQLSH